MMRQFEHEKQDNDTTAGAALHAPKSIDHNTSSSFYTPENMSMTLLSLKETQPMLMPPAGSLPAVSALSSFGELFSGFENMDWSQLDGFLLDPTGQNSNDNLGWNAVLYDFSVAQS